MTNRTFNDGIDAAIALHRAEVNRQYAIMDQHLAKEKAEGRTTRWREFRFNTQQAIEHHGAFINQLKAMKESES